MDPDIMKCYLEAGRIASTVRDETAKTVEESMYLIDIAEYAERTIRLLDGKIATDIKNGAKLSRKGKKEMEYAGQ